MKKYFVSETKAQGYVGQYTSDEILVLFQNGQIKNEFVFTESIGQTYSELIKRNDINWIPISEFVFEEKEPNINSSKDPLQTEEIKIQPLEDEAGTNKNQLVNFVIKLSSTVGGLIMAGAVLHSTSAKFSSGSIPFVLQLVMTGLLVGTNIGLYRHKDWARIVFLLLLPIGFVLVGASYPSLLWTKDVPFTIFGVFIYVPIVFFLTRIRVLRYFGKSNFTWLERGGPFMLLISVVSSILTFILFTGFRNNLNLDIILIILLLHYHFGLLAITIPVRIPSKENIHGSKNIPLVDKFAFILYVPMLFFAIYFRATRPDLDSIAGLEKVSGMHFEEKYDLKKFEIRGDLLEQHPFWIVESRDSIIIDKLKDSGFHITQYGQRGVTDLYNMVDSELGFEDRNKVLFFTNAPNDSYYDSKISYHYIIISENGRLSAHIFE
jgi:hypothetical protein